MALKDRPDISVFNEIGVIEHMMRHAVVKHLPPGMTYAHFELLTAFGRLGDGQTPAQLAVAMMMTKGALTNILQKMEGMGLVTVLGDVKDRRKKRVRLTRHGAETYEQILRDMKWKIDALREGFTEAEFRQALPFLRSLRTFLEDIKESDAPAAASR